MKGYPCGLKRQPVDGVSQSPGYGDLESVKDGMYAWLEL